MNNKELLEHHLYFLSKHRGSRESLPNLEIIHSDMAEFNLAFPLSKNEIAQINDSFNIYLADWVENVKETDLKRNKSGSYTYMLLSDSQADWKTNREIQIKKAVTVAEIEDFSLVQGIAFCDTPEEFDEWHPWLRKRNLENISEQTQYFYVAYQDAKPIGITLAVLHNNLLGIYGVATIPEARKQGVSTTLIKHIVETHKPSEMTLQVSTDSYAHNFYRQLGFKDVFESAVFS